jgi:cell wall-associated NlpC family hydrolase
MDPARMTTAAEVIEQARKYVDTPFLDKGRRIGQGIDCVGLVLCVAEDLAILDRRGVPLLRTDYVDYSPQPNDAFVHETCIDRLERQAPGAPFYPGAVVSMRIPTYPCHVGIIAERPESLYLIHAYSSPNQKVNKCSEIIFDVSWMRRVVGIFKFTGVDY